MRIIKFVYNALNHSNEICHNLLHTKIINTTPININSDRDWYSVLENLLAKVKMNNFLSYF